MAFFDEADGALFTGDAVLGRGTTVVNPPDGDLSAYLRSLSRMQELRPRTIYPGHGPTVFDGKAKLEEYVAHRAMREQQVLDAIEAGHRTIQDMVPVIYAEYPPELHELAGRQVLAQLMKLEREGRVAHVGPPDKAAYELVEARDCERCGRPALPRSRYCGKPPMYATARRSFPGMLAPIHQLFALGRSVALITASRCSARSSLDCRARPTRWD